MPARFSFLSVFGVGLGLFLAIASPLWGANAPLIGVNAHQQLIVAFPSPVRYVDFGSPFLRGTQLHQLQYLAIQATQDSIPETTLSAVTANGQYYSYRVRYQKELPGLVYQVSDHQYLPSPSLFVSSQKTTHFVAPHPIEEWVGGNDTLLVASANGIENMVRVKAQVPFQWPTSLALLSPQGKLVTYQVWYNDSTSCLSEYMGTEQPSKVQFQHHSTDSLALQQAAQNCLCLKYSMNHCGEHNHKMTFSLVGIYSYEDQLLFRFVLQNRNEIDYAIDFMKVYIEDKKSAQYAALQETELLPFYAYSADARFKTFLPARQMTEFVLFFPRFTLPKERVLAVELFEKNGGRHLHFQVSSKDLLRAKRLPLPEESTQTSTQAEVAEEKLLKSSFSEPSSTTKKASASQPALKPQPKRIKKEPSWEEDSFW